MEEHEDEPPRLQIGVHVIGENFFWQLAEKEVVIHYAPAGEEKFQADVAAFGQNVYVALARPLPLARGVRKAVRRARRNPDCVRKQYPVVEKTCLLYTSDAADE